MAGKNLVIILGKLGRDPEMKYTASGTAICNFSVATSESWKDKNTGEKQEKTEWHRIVAYRQLGEVCGKYLEKGRDVFIEGKIQTREWTDKDGAKRYTTEIIAENVTFVGGSGGKNKNGGHAPPETPKPPRQAVDDSDIPF